MVPGREMPRKLLADMLGRLAVALAAGIGLRRCWRMEVSRVPAAWRPAMEKVAAAIEAGEPLADAMAAAGAAFPPFVRGMVAVGDRTGREVETLREVSQTLERGVRTAQAMRRSLAGPLGQLAVAVVVVGLLILAAGWMPHDLLGIGLKGPRGLAIYVAGLVATAGVGRVAFGVAVADWRRHGPVRLVVDRMPVVGAASRAAEAAAWCRVASLASGAGLDAGRLVTLAASVAPGLAVDPRGLEERLRSGATLAQALDRTGRFPTRLLESLAVGEATGNTAEVLDRVAAEYDDEARSGFEVAARGVGFVVWAAVAALIAAIVMRIFATYVGAIRDAAG